MTEALIGTHLQKEPDIAKTTRALLALIKQFIRPLTGHRLCRQSSASDVAAEVIQQQESLRLLGLAFQGIREDQKLSVSELTKTSGIAENRIQALEAGELDADLEMLLALGDGLGIRISALFIRAEKLSKEAGHED